MISFPINATRRPLNKLPGLHARRGRTGRLRTAGGNRPLRMDRRQGIRRKGNDHPAQEAAQRRTERSGRRGQQEHQPDPPGRKSAPSPTSSPGESTRTDYRRPLHTFEQTITAALSTYVFKTTPRITFNLKEFELACFFQRAPELSRPGLLIEGARLVSHYEHSREGGTQLLNLPTFCRRVDQET